MSKIVIDARELRTSTGRYIERLLRYLQQTKSEHDYIVLLKPKDFDSWEPMSPKFHKLECPYEEFTFSEQIGFLKQLNELGADLVHFGMTQQPIGYKGKVVTTIHDLTTLRFTNPDKNSLVFKFKQGVYAYVTKKVAHKSVKIITGTHFVKSDLVSYAKIDPSKVTVTHESADPITENPTPLPDLQNKKFIMYVGRPTPHKNLERLIEAFTLLRAQHPDLQLVLAGKKDANYQRIEQSIPEKTKRNVLFTDFVSEGELRWLYENCEAYVFPSLSEGFGLPGLEAMQHGAPVASSNATCLPEVYGDAAHYFDPKDTQAMSDAINEVLTNKDLRQKLITAGDAQVKKYSWKRMAEETLRVYESALRAD
jgi:glycosyltransferase involved in cell wall biosynthesis